MDWQVSFCPRYKKSHRAKQWKGQEEEVLQGVAWAAVGEIAEKENEDSLGWT